MKRRWKWGGAILLLLGALCAVLLCLQGKEKGDETKGAWGSFTDQPVVTWDGQYRAEHQAVREEGMDVSMIRVDIYLQETNERVDTFYPARAADFWGVCWEENTHHLWIQSADAGIQCYERTVSGWRIKENAVRPDSILSKWDKAEP